MHWPKQMHATYYQAQLELSLKDRAIKELVVRNSWYLEPVYLQNQFAIKFAMICVVLSVHLVVFLITVEVINQDSFFCAN